MGYSAYWTPQWADPSQAGAREARGGSGRGQRSHRWPRLRGRRMSPKFKPEALACAEPSTCTVAIAALTDLAREGQLPYTTFSADTPWSRVYDSRFGRT